MRHVVLGIDRVSSPHISMGFFDNNALDNNALTYVRAFDTFFIRPEFIFGPFLFLVEPGIDCVCFEL